MPRMSPTGADPPIAPTAPRAVGVAPSPGPASCVIAGNPIMLPADEEEKLACADSAQATAAPSGATMASSSSWCLLSGNPQAPSIDDMDLEGADVLHPTPTAPPSVGVTPSPASCVLSATEEIDLAGADLPLAPTVPPGTGVASSPAWRVLAGNSRVPTVDDELSGADLDMADSAPSGVTVLSSSSRCLLTGNPRARPTGEMDLDRTGLLAPTASPGVGVASSPVWRVLAGNSRVPPVDDELSGADLALADIAPSGVTMPSSSSQCLLTGNPRARPTDEMDLLARTASPGVGVASPPVWRVVDGNSRVHQVDEELTAGADLVLATTARSGISMAPTSSRSRCLLTGNLRVSSSDEDPTGTDLPLAPAPLPGVGVASLPQWCILATIPRVTSDQELHGGDFSVAITAPPGVSMLSVPPRICPDPITDDNSPSLLAADPSGLLLLYATQGERTGPVLCGERFAWRRFIDGYFVCDAASTSAFRLPDPQDTYIVNSGNVGLITMPGHDYYIVAELQPIIGTNLAKLLCFSSATGLWEEKSMDYPLDQVRPWGSNGVLSYLGKLWWVDISWGLLTCLPSEHSPDLKFVPLPIGKKVPYQRSQVDLEMYRCAKLSSGKLCFVEICCPAKPRVTVHKLRRIVERHGHRKVPWVVIWTLLDAEAGLWRREYEVSFEDVWLHRSYSESGLPKKKLPKLATVDPLDLHVVYFFLDKFLFGVDFRTKTVLKHSVYKLDNPPSKHMSSHFVHAWEISRAGLPCCDTEKRD